MLKIVLKSIWQKKLSIIFIFIQICIICYFTIDILTNFNVFLKQERNIHNVLGDVEEKLVKIEFQDLYPTGEFSSKVCELDNYLKEIDSIKFSGGFFTTTYIFDQLEKNEKYIEMNKKKIIGSKKPAQVTDCLLLDDNMDNLMNINIKSGRNLEKEDFNISSGETIPILIGSDLNNILDVGDELDADDMMSYTGRTKFIVVGIMESDSYSIGRENLIANKLIDLNNYIVMPVYNELKTNMLPVTSKAESYYVCVNNKEDIEKVKLEIINKSNKIGLNTKVDTIEEVTKQYKENNIDVYKIILTTIMFTIVFVILSISSAILTSIKKRKYELGIRIATGTSMRKIKLMFVLEIFIISFLSLIVSVLYWIYNQYELYINFYNKPFVISEVMNLRILISVILIVTIIILGSSYIPLKRIEKLQPKDLIGREEL